MIALQRSVLLRGFFSRRGYFTLADISPQEYRQGALTDGSDRRALRVWLSADVIFEASRGEGGGERITEGGLARLDSALASNVSRVGDGVRMIEGYSHRQVSSRCRQRRVDAARIEGDCRRPGGDTWNGVALAVILER